MEYVYIESGNPPGGRPEYDLWFNHIMVKIENVVIDNNGFHSIDRFKCDLHPLKNDKLLEMINIKELWNNIYDHTNTPCLVNDIKKLFSEPNSYERKTWEDQFLKRFYNIEKKSNPVNIKFDLQLACFFEM